MYATPQKIQPKKESNRLLIRASKSAKKGMTSAMMKAKIQVSARMPAQLAQPMRVLLDLCLVPSNARKKMNRADTEA